MELLCANLQKDELAALNTSMSAEGLSTSQQQELVTVRSFLPAHLPRFIATSCRQHPPCKAVADQPWELYDPGHWTLSYL